MKGIGFTFNTKEYGPLYCVVNTGRVIPESVEFIDGRTYRSFPPHVEDIEIVSVEAVSEPDPRYKKIELTPALAFAIEEYAEEYILAGERL